MSKRYMMAWVTAFVAVLAVGVGRRIAADRLWRPSDSVPLPKGTLAHLPSQIGDWSGSDVPMDERVILATDTDDLLNRIYRRYAGADAVGLYIAYGIKAHDLLPHRPEVCYPGSGWTLQANDLINLVDSDASTVACRVFRFTRGAMATETLIVLNYYIVDGQYSADASLLRSKITLGATGMRYMAQVQITCRTTTLRSIEMASELVQRFAVDSISAIRNLFPDHAQTTTTTGRTSPTASTGRGATL